MEFLIRLETTLPPDLPEHARAELLEREATRGRELVTDGVIRSIWRIPGRLANVAIWSAPDTDRLHELLTGLPLWRWMHVEVTALASHPLMASQTSGTAG
jgi:muconolactone D-isomerase